MTGPRCKVLKRHLKRYHLKVFLVVVKADELNSQRKDIMRLNAEPGKAGTKQKTLEYSSEDSME